MLLLELEAHPHASKGQLNGWYQQYHKTAEFSRWLVEAILSDNGARQRNGSWLIKKHLEQKGALTMAEWHQIATHLTQLDEWELLLHLCQCFAKRPSFSPETAALVRPFLERCAAHQKPFVRAWAITGLHELAKDFPDLRPYAVKWVNTAVNDPAKSVQARIRNLK